MDKETVALPHVPPLPTKAAGERSDPGYFGELARRVQVPDESGKGEGGLRGENGAEREARRIDERLPASYRAAPASEMTFDPRLVYELALGIDKPLVVFERYGYDEDQARALIGRPEFVTTLQKYKAEIAESGISFKLKAKIQAEDLLTHSYLLATDPETPASVRADLIKWTAKMAGLEPVADKNAGTGGGGFALNITFAGAAPAAVQGRVIDGTVTREV